MPATGNGDILPRPAPEPPSVVVITKDEEANIEACLRCLDFTDDVVVLDSGSTDRTTEIARYFANVSVIHRAFDTEWKQRNHALHGPKFKHPWVYICDADERVDRELVDEILRVTNDPDTTHAAFRLRYRNMFMGRWINHASTYPVWIIRLVRPERVTYEVRETNIHPIVDGTVGELRGHFTHYSFNSGLVRWFQKHNFYSTREAVEGAKTRAAGRPSLRSLRNPDPMLRSRAAKNLSYFLPGRALWRFAFAYLLRGGFRDGRPGLHYCLMTAMYEYWIELKMKEIERGDRARVAPALARRMAGTGNNAAIATPGQTIDAYLEHQIQSADAASDERLRTGRTRHRLPARPAWRFFSAFILRGGFLRGRAGYHLARLDAGTEYITGLLHRDKRLRAIGTGPSPLSPVPRGEARGIGDCPRAGRGEGPSSNARPNPQPPTTNPTPQHP